jgi:sphingomyelin phosphodiesterase acid-like 3
LKTWIARALAILATGLSPGALAADEVPALPFAPEPGQGVFLIITDIHFDPFADPALVEQLVAAEASAWPGIFESAGPQAFAQYGSDANYPLMTSALAAAGELLPRPDFVLYAGDYLVHGFETKFDIHAGGGRDAFARFVIKTMTFVSDRLQAAFPEAPVYGTLGNDDAICGNYMIAPGQAFLAAVGELWAGQSAYPEAFADFGVGGFYAVPHPTVQGRDLIVLNTVLWSMNYENRCNPAGGDPGAAQLAWLEWTLYKTKLRGRSASLLFHIPPGIDGYSSSHGSGHGSGACRADVTPLLKEAYEKPFLALLERYRDILQIGYAGHTHMDDFRVVASGGEPILLTHITPAISPIYNNNPGFGLVLYDRTSGDLLDYATVYLTNLAGAGRGEAAKWAIEYTFQGAYGYTAYEPRSAALLARSIRAEPAVRDDYVTFYPVTTASTDPPIDGENWLAYACGQTEFTIEAFAACYCGSE